MKILHIDSNHPTLIPMLIKNGHVNHTDFISSKHDIGLIIKNYDGLILRSRFKIDKEFIDKAINLKFIARLGSGIENIDSEYAKTKKIEVISSPEGNSNAVGEHAMGLLLSLLNNIITSSVQVKKGIWIREQNRGYELEGKTVAILGLGNTGKSFAKKIAAFNCNVIFHDINDNIKSDIAKKSSLDDIYENTDVLSLHLPHTKLTFNLFNKSFIEKFNKPYGLLNTSRGSIVNTADLIQALKTNKVLGAGLDVLDIESSSFTEIINDKNENFHILSSFKNVIITPHIAGWTFESNIKLSEIVVNKIKKLF